MQLPGTRNRDELLVDTACWANLAFACIVGALTRVLAPLYALVVEQPEITLASPLTTIDPALLIEIDPLTCFLLTLSR
jgi:hypothetical protein